MTLDLQTLRKLLNPVIIGEGFKKSGSVWVRNSGDFIDVVELQRSAWDALCTMNVGVYHPEIFELVDQNSPVKLTAAHCLVETRAGLLMSNGKTDDWWNLKSPSTPQLMLDTFKDHVLPFIGSHHSLAKMIEFLEDKEYHKRLSAPGSYYLALLYIKSNQKNKGCIILEEIARSPHAPWTEPAQRLIKFCGCDH